MAHSLQRFLIGFTLAHVGVSGDSFAQAKTEACHEKTPTRGERGALWGQIFQSRFRPLKARFDRSASQNW